MTTTKIKIVPGNGILSIDGGEFFEKWHNLNEYRSETAERIGIELDEILGLESGEMTTDADGWKEINLRVFANK
jgi:hypothetical protein